MLSALLQGDPNDNAAGSGTTFDTVAGIALDLSGEAERRFLPLAGLAGNAADIALAVMSITQVRIVELTLPQVRDRIRTIPNAGQWASPPWIVLRSYVGVPQVTFAKKSNADAEAWARLRGNLVRANLRSAATSDDKIELRFSEPTVFAFEAWSVAEFPKLANVPDDLRVETALVVVKGPSAGGIDRYKDLKFPAERISSFELAITDAHTMLKREFEGAGIRGVEKVFPVSGAGGMYVAFLRHDLSKFGLSKVKAEEFDNARRLYQTPPLPRPMSDPPQRP